MIPITPPGNTLRDLLEQRSLTQTELAERLGLTKKTVNEILMGKAPITADTSLGLEKIFGIPAHFWDNREQQYREYLARIEEHKRLEIQLPWLEQIPLREMIHRGWIKKRDDKVSQLIELLHFYGVADVRQWETVWNSLEARFRRPAHGRSDIGSLSAWLRFGRLHAERMECKPYEESTFRSKLREIRSYTLLPFDEAIAKTSASCRECGVAFVVAKELRATQVSGVALWLSPEKALVQLSLRYKSDDQFWFTFFHEAAHLLLHNKREVYVDWVGDDDNKEQEANQFAMSTLIPPANWNEILRHKEYTEDSIRMFSKRSGIAPGILVGRMQREHLIRVNTLNHLKKTLNTYPDAPLSE